jgi:hypothetical protein
VRNGVLLIDEADDSLSEELVSIAGGGELG